MPGHRRVPALPAARRHHARRRQDVPVVRLQRLSLLPRRSAGLRRFRRRAHRRIYRRGAGLLRAGDRADRRARRLLGLGRHDGEVVERDQFADDGGEARPARGVEGGHRLRRQRRPLERRRPLHGRRHDVRQCELAVVDVRLARRGARSRRGRRCLEGDVADPHRQRGFLVQAMGLEPAARRVLERDSRPRSLRRRGRAGVHPVGLAGRLQEPGAAGGRGARRRRQGSCWHHRRLGPQISVQRLSRPARRLARLHRHALVGPLAEGQDPSPRGRLAAIAGMARRIERAEQIGLRRRDRQMGG